jgi:Raf kinase inhibitor-like YbhB/YbcL family protein
MLTRNNGQWPVTRRICLSLFALILLCSCQRKSENAQSNQTRPEATGVEQHVEQTGGEKMSIKVTSTAFPEGGMIPKQYTCDGRNISPPLAWDSVPGNAKTLALTADDPDAPGRTWVHWVVFNLPASAKNLPENVLPQEMITGGGKQGTNDFRKIGYGGPCPPSGTHRYYFKVYALDKELGLDSRTTKDQVLKAMEGHILAQGELMGRYRR